MSLIIATGSNLGNSMQYLNVAEDHLKSKFKFIAKSNIYRSEPVDYLEQPEFLNQVIEFEVPILTPIEILKILQRIEAKMGRKKIISKGPRIIDLDIIFIGNTKLESEELTIPHPSLFDRSFVVLPLMELPFFKEISSIYKFPTSFSSISTINTL